MTVFRVALLTLVFLSFVPPAVAAKEAIWNFRNENVAGEWELTGIDAQPMRNGLHIRAKEEGAMLRRDPNFVFVPDAISITLGPSDATEALLLWSRRDGVMLKRIFPIRGKNSERIDLVLHEEAGEIPFPARVGLELPNGAQITLTEIRFYKWSLNEKWSEAWKSFWTMNSLQAYSSNFLWGPMITFNPFDRVMLFTKKIPGFSAHWIFYGVFLIISFALMLCSRISTSFVRWCYAHRLYIMLGTLGILWFIYDVRMGLEMLQYAKADFDTYISKPVGKKIMRNYGDFYDVTDRAMPIISDHNHYIFFGPDNSFDSALRYLTYPSIPHPFDTAPKDSRLWYIYDRMDVVVDRDGQLVLSDGSVLTAPGEIMQRFTNDSFLFLVR